LAEQYGGALEGIRAQETQRESKARFQLVARANNDAVWDWDLKTNRIWWNEAFRTMFGCESAELAAGADSWFNRLHPEDKERVVNGIQSVLRSGAESWSD